MNHTGDHRGGPVQRAYRSQRPVVLVDICADPTCVEWEAAAVSEGYRAILALPLAGSVACSAWSALLPRTP